jgi:hypothetical protein
LNDSVCPTATQTLSVPSYQPIDLQLARPQRQCTETVALETLTDATTSLSSSTCSARRGHQRRIWLVDINTKITAGFRSHRISLFPADRCARCGRPAPCVASKILYGLAWPVISTSFFLLTVFSAWIFEERKTMQNRVFYRSFYRISKYTEILKQCDALTRKKWW